MEDGDYPQQVTISCLKNDNFNIYDIYFVIIVVQGVTGAFMKNCTLNYASYRNIFPIWALAQYHKRLLNKLN